MRKRYNSERRAWRGRSYRKGGERVSALRDRIAITETIFECRCCGDASPGLSDGTIFKVGWGRIAHIDGPNAICAWCIDYDEVKNFKDEYPNAEVV